MSTTHEIIDWQGIALSVDYSPNRFGTGVHHIEIRVLQPEGATIPVTDTGYRSHFFSDAVEPFGGPGRYVLAWLDHHAASPEWKRRETEAPGAKPALKPCAPQARRGPPVRRSEPLPMRRWRR